jgi:2,4-dienoyl-CoA reductase-like NADH-dependent reductase (Old Yellow Enzyme family)
MPSRLFSPLDLGRLTLPNRVMVSPMCTYSAADGRPGRFHLVHLGRFALGGAGLVVIEATAVTPHGRISHGDLGIWDDDHGAALAVLAEVISDAGSVPAIQLAHAGRKASVQAPWEGNGPLTARDALRGAPPWPVVGPTGAAAGPGWPAPHRLEDDEIEAVIAAWGAAARRAVAAGFRVIDLHGAHGYLLHSFLSPISNTRDDTWGGDAERRMRFPLRVVEAVRAAIPDDVALFYRTSAVDGIEGGLTLADTEEFARRLRDAGVDVMDVSSGGVIADRSRDTRIRRGYAFHAPYSAAIRSAVGMPVASVGLVVAPEQAEAMLERGDADIVALGRELLVEPNWALRARAELDGVDFDAWNPQSGWWLDKRQPVIERLRAEGETPMSRYERAPETLPSDLSGR